MESFGAYMEAASTPHAPNVAMVRGCGHYRTIAYGHTVSLPLRGPSLCSVHMLLCGTYHTLYACQKMTACKAYHRSLMLFLGPRSRQDTANVVGWSEDRSPAVEDRSLRSVDVPLQQIHVRTAAAQ